MEVWNAHRSAKHRLNEYVNREANAGMDIDVLTIGFARRAAAYKRADLIFDEANRLRRIAREVRKLQLIFASKAYLHDEEGKQLIQRIIQLGRSMSPDAAISCRPNYDMRLARLLTSGLDGDHAPCDCAPRLLL